MNELVMPWPVVALIVLLALVAVGLAVRLLLGARGGGRGRRSDRH